MSRPEPLTDRTTNGHDDNAALARRGSLSIHWPAGDCKQSPQGWFDPETERLAKPTGKRGRQSVFSDAAIQTCLMLKALLGLPLRQTTGMVGCQAPFGSGPELPRMKRYPRLGVAAPC